MKFKIVVKEVLEIIKEVEAENVDTAIQIIKKQYQNCELVLDASHHTSTEIFEFESKK